MTTTPRPDLPSAKYHETVGDVIEDLQGIGGKAFSEDRVVSEWSVTGTADNAILTVTKALVAGERHFITSISASFSVANIKLLELKDDTSVIGNYHVHNQRDIVFEKPVEITVAKAANLVLAASGTATEIGAATMTGFTRV